MNNEELDIQFRFPIFRNEKWDLYKLSEIAEYTNGRAHEQDIDTNGKYIVVNSKYISTDGEVVKYSNTANCLAEKNDILMVLSDVPNGRAIAKCYLVKENNKYTVNQRICKITPKQGIESSLLYYLMNRNPYFLSFDDGVKQTNLRNDDVLNFEILLPTNPAEQQKIAACLSSLDDVIAGHEEKLTALEEHKKGLMQNLFPQEGATQPKYRFPEFENDGDWVENVLDDVFNFVRGPFGGALKKDIFVKEGFAVYEQSHAIYSDFSEFRYYINSDKYKELIRFSVKPNDLIMSCSGTMGKFALIPENCSEGVINQALLKLSAKKGYNILYLKYLMETDLYQNKLLSQSAGGAIKNVVGVNEIKLIKIYLPKTLVEQQKIASVLSSVDELIVAQREKIEALKEHKKGLMQGLFPKIES